MRDAGRQADLSRASPNQSIIEPRVPVSLTLYAAVQRSFLTETQTRYQLFALVVLVVGVELLVMPLLGRRPSIWSLAVNAIVSASGMILTKWQSKGSTGHPLTESYSGLLPVYDPTGRQLRS